MAMKSGESVGRPAVGCLRTPAAMTSVKRICLPTRGARTKQCAQRKLQSSLICTKACDADRPLSSEITSSNRSFLCPHNTA